MAITQKPAPRQTIPYADRPFVDPRTGRLTQDAYQFLQRISGGSVASIQNVTTVISTVNTQDGQIAELVADVGTLEAEVTVLESEVRAIAPTPPGLPSVPPPPSLPPGPLVAPTPPYAGPPPAFVPPAAALPPPDRVPRPETQMLPPARSVPVVLPYSLGGTGISDSPGFGDLLIGDPDVGGWGIGSVKAGTGIDVFNYTTGPLISLDVILGGYLLGNAGTATASPYPIAVGAGLTMSVSGTLSATTAAGVGTVVAGSGLSGGTITSTGTIALGTIAADSLLGNVGTVGAVPSAVPIGTGLTVASGTLDALWNAGTVTTLGPNMSLSGGTLNASGTFVGDWSAGTVTTIGSGITVTSGTISASGGGGGALTLITTVNASGLTEIDLTPVDTSSYDYEVVFRNVELSGGGTIYIEMATGSPPVYQTTGYYWTGVFVSGGSAVGASGNNSTGLSYSSTSAPYPKTQKLFLSNSGFTGIVFWSGPATTLLAGTVTQQLIGSVITGIRLRATSGTFSGGSGSLYQLAR